MLLLSVYFATFICRRQLESRPKGFIFHFIVWDMYIKSVHVLKLKFLQLYQPKTMVLWKKLVIYRKPWNFDLQWKNYGTMEKTMVL